MTIPACPQIDNNLSHWGHICKQGASLRLALRSLQARRKARNFTALFGKEGYATAASWLRTFHSARRKINHYLPLRAEQ